MSQLIINFDKNLEIKSIEDKKKLNDLSEQLILNLQNSKNLYSEYESTKNLIKEDSCNGFINTFLAAYNSHKPLRLRPDDINLALQLVWSCCLNLNSEKFRSEFVNYKTKMELKVKSLVFDLNFFCQQFANLMKKNIKNPEFIEHFTKEFTTTTQLIKTVTNQVLMNTLKEYFSCSMILGCGISKVIMEGTTEDWNKLAESYKYFKILFAETELKSWFPHADIIMNNFILMRNLQDSGEVDASEDLKEFWLRVICYVPQGSGNQTILGGWVRLLTPYSSSNDIIGLDKPIMCLDLNNNRPEYSRDYSQQNVLAIYYAATRWSSLQKSLIETPAILFDYDGIEHEVEFESGFYPPYERDDGSISTNIGFLMRTDKTIEKKKLQKYYIRLGVKIDTNDSDRIQIPRSLQKEKFNILEIFDAHFLSLYGVDPEEEKRKEYLISNGVYIDLDTPIQIGTMHIKVPEKFKENNQDKKNKFQQEVRNLFINSNTKFIKIIYY
jgi:hypothetical protein